MNFDPLSFAIGKHGDSGPVRDVVSYLIGRVAATAGEIWQTLTNVAVASFTAVSATLRELIIDVMAVQSGSGDPSPDNVRHISGWTGANVVVSPTLDAQDGTTYPVSWQTEAGAVYGGTLDVITGKLKITHSGHIFDGTETLYDSSSMLSRCANYDVSDVWMRGYGTTTYTEDLNCSHFTPSQTFIVAANRGNHVLVYDDSQGHQSIGFGYSGDVGTDLASLIAYMAAQYTANTPVTVVYKLATPQTVQLTPTEVNALIGQNNIFADTGNINTITFRTH